MGWLSNGVCKKNDAGECPFSHPENRRGSWHSGRGQKRNRTWTPLGGWGGGGPSWGGSWPEPGGWGPQNNPWGPGWGGQGGWGKGGKGGKGRGKGGGKGGW
jgi:hypothetical protein